MLPLFHTTPPQDVAGDALVFLVYFGVICGVFAVLAFIAEYLDRREQRGRNRRLPNGR